MEVVTKTEYQDVYRVTDGVLLVVNKFVPMFKNNCNYYEENRKRKYSAETKDLYVLQRDYEDEYNMFPEKLLKGTVTYLSRPVVSTNNPTDWTYQLKTTGDAFSGNVFRFKELLSSTLYIVRTCQIR